MTLNKKERYKIVPSSYLILIKNKKILLARRCNTGYEDGKYGLIAGHGEENESARETLAREAKEEAGIKISLSTIKTVHIMHRKASQDERVDFFMTAGKFVGAPKIMEPGKCDEMRWFPLDKLPNNTIGYIKQAIECCQEGIFYSEWGWNNKQTI